jgi:hypothetical protein
VGGHSQHITLQAASSTYTLQYPNWQQSARLRILVPVSPSPEQAYRRRRPSPSSSVHLHLPTNNQLGAEPSSSLIIPTLNMYVHLLTHQVLTSTIFLGWTCLVVSLSQAGKRTAMTALADAAKGIAQGSLETMEGQHGMGVFASMAGGE